MVLSIRVVPLVKEPNLRGFMYQYEQFPKLLLRFKLDFLPPFTHCILFLLNSHVCLFLLNRSFE